MIFSACVTFTCHNGRNEGLCLHRLGYEFVVLCEKLSFPMPRTSLTNHTTVGTISSPPKISHFDTLR